MTAPFEAMPPTLPARGRQVDPYVGGMIILTGLVVAGFVLIALGKRSLARYVVLAAQLPGLVSGCVAGLGLIAVGAGLAVVFHSRRMEAVLRADNEELLDESAAVLELLLRAEVSA